jgi:hypothetical protein
MSYSNIAVQDRCRANLSRCTREVYDIIHDLWRSFKFLHEKRLLCTESLAIGSILISEAKVKIQIFTEKTFGETKYPYSNKYGLL